MTNEFSQVEDAVKAIAAGQLVIVLDDEDRENEGDFICAAEKCTPELVNFMLDGRGMLCVPMLPETAAKLQLEAQKNTGSAKHVLRTAFTAAVDHHSVRTGITAEERCTTIHALANPASHFDDFVSPGHVNPLIAKEGGVLRRAGHTEASIDLVRLAGLEPVGVLIEILNKSGDRATRAELLELAAKHDIVMITIEQLIRYRRQREQLVFRTGEAELPTKRGPFRVIAYGVKYEAQEPVVLTMGDLSSVEAPLVRLHSSCFTGDLIESLRCDCGDQLNMALDMIGQEGVGVLVYLPQEGRGIGLSEKIKAYALQDDGLDTVQANLALGYKADPRDYGVGIQILKNLGLSKIRLMTNNPKKRDAFIYDGFDLEIVDQIPITPPSNKHNADYLKTKRDKMGHNLPPDDLV